MRHWINLFEARMTDGVWNRLTMREMMELTRRHDLRGIGHDDEIFMWPAMNAVHMRVRRDLGIPSWEGFNFYTATTAVAWEYDDEAENDTLNGREDWVADGARPTFTLEDINVYVEQDARGDCLENKAFARLVTPRTVDTKK